MLPIDFTKRMKELLGEEWLNKSLFRIGASSLMEDLEKRLISSDE